MEKETPISTLAGHSPVEPAALPPRNMRGLFWVALLLGVLSSVFLFALDNTIVANIQPSIIQDLGDIDKLPWISVGFALGGVATSLLWGRLYGLIDSKKLYCIAVLLFEIGSAICGAAPTLNALIVGRAIAGLGGSGIYIGTVHILTNLTTTQERPLYMSLVGAMWSTGTILGPIIGGAFADSSASWRWSFYINLCVAAVAAPIYLFLLPVSKPFPDTSAKAILQRIDATGVVLFAGATITIVMAISFGGALYAWNSGQIIGLFVATGVLWIIFGLQQGFAAFTTPEHRLFPVELLKSAQQCILFAQVAICISCIYIPIYFIPLYYQLTRGESAIQSGVRLLPFVFLAVVGAMLNGAIMGKTGIYMPWFLFGGILITAGGVCLHTITLDTSNSMIYGFEVLTALGTGFFVQAPFSVAQAKVQPHQLTATTAFISCGQISGITFSLSIANSVFLNLATDKISGILPNVPREAVQGTVAGAGSTLFNNLSAAVRQDVLVAIVDSISQVYIMVIAAGALAIVLSLLMKRERLILDGNVVPMGA